MKKNLYIISGATGMTGNELSRQLISNGHTVIAFDNFFCSSLDTVKDLIDHPHFIFHNWDINSSENMDHLRSDIQHMKSNFASVIYVNCAAVVHTEYFYHINSTFQTNVLGMQSFLQQAIDVNADIFINCSTSEVYSMQSWSENGVKESDYVLLAHAEHSQRTSYAAGKLMTEFFLKDAVIEHKIKGCSIRFANVYSKNELYPKHIIPHIIHELSTKHAVTLLENSKVNRRTFLHNIDSCSAVIALMQTPSALDGTVYNVATDEEISIINLVYLCAKKMGIMDPQITFCGYRQSDPQRRILNTDKIRERTKWFPAITLEKGIEMCLEGYKK